MKNFLLICLVCCAAAFEIPDEKRKEYTQECIRGSGVSLDSLLKFKRGVFNDYDEELKEFNFCFYKKLGAVNEDGTSNEENLKKVLTGSEEDVEKLVRQCVLKKGTSEEMWYEAHKCFWDNSPENRPTYIPN